MLLRDLLRLTKQAKVYLEQEQISPAVSLADGRENLIELCQEIWGEIHLNSLPAEAAGDQKILQLLRENLEVAEEIRRLDKEMEGLIVRLKAKKGGELNRMVQLHKIQRMYHLPSADDPILLTLMEEKKK